MSWEVLQGDVREKLQEIPEKSIQCCVTSPPYWGLRDYGTEGQLGLEKTPDEYVINMVEVFRGVWRVLRDDGVAWLNLGDSYNGSGGAGGDYSARGLKAGQPKYPGRKIVTLKPKDLVGIPWRVAFALQADGWYLRSDIIWHKPNPMPESVTDRPTKAHEYIFLLSKRQKYFYDAEAIREPIKENSGACSVRTATKPEDKRESQNLTRKYDVIKGANKRSVWTVATKPYPESHFAVFPPKLIEPCILAGTSPQACEVCGSPWERVVERETKPQGRSTGETYTAKAYKSPQSAVWGKKKNLGGDQKESTTTGWRATCAHDNEGRERSVVLDPFAGSGTTLWVAENHGRDSVGIELNSEYVKLIEKRMANFQQTIFSI